MDWQEQLIRVYLEICELYDQEHFEFKERFSNNSKPEFTDCEVATVYLWGILSGHQKQKNIHKYMSQHLIEWFPNLPKYSAYIDRVNRLDDFLCALTYRLFRHLPFDTVYEMKRIIDAEKSDLFDVLAYVAYALPTLTREERATTARVEISGQFNGKQEAFLNFVLQYYVSVGVEELDQSSAGVEVQREN